MKHLLYILLFCASILISCDTSPELNGNWHLSNLSGGIAGINQDYDRGDIIWTFKEALSTLTIEDNIDGSTSGNFTYSILSANSKLFLVVNGEERGEYMLFDNELIINQNSYSTSTGADGFIYKFSR